LERDKNSIFYISGPFHRHVACKDWTILADFEKMAKKVRFCSFLTLAVEKK